MAYRSFNTPAPAPRYGHFEELLCRAVDLRVLVELRYDDDTAPRLVAPHVVYVSGPGNVNCLCVQIDNPGQPMDDHDIRTFVVGRVRTLRMTDTFFRPESSIDPANSRYRHVLTAV